MPPTFFYYLGFLIYAGLSMVTLIIFLPLSFVQGKRKFSYKVIGTVLISFPILIFSNVVLILVAILPGLVFFKLIEIIQLNPDTKFGLSLIVLIIFAILMALFALNAWLFASRLLCYKIDKKPIDEILDNDKYLGKIVKKIYRFRS